MDLERNIDYCKCAKLKVAGYKYEDVIRRIGLISLYSVSILVAFRWSADKDCPLVICSFS
jgi:hypothetical protein